MGLRVTGTVVDTAGRPVAGAKVEGRDRGLLRALATYTTGANGVFELCGFRQTQVLTLEAKKGKDLVSDMYGPAALGQGGLSSIVLTLYPTAAIAGKVVDERGRPLPGVKVYTSLSAAGHDRLMGTGWDDTGADGAFHITGLATGKHTLWVRRRGMRSSTRAAEPNDMIKVEPGQTLSGVTLVLDAEDARPTIAGRVTDGAGHPVRDARVTAYGLTGGMATTDDNGSYEVRVRPGGPGQLYRLDVSHDQHANDARDGVPAGAVDVDFVLRPSGAIEGRVLDADSGTPIPEFQMLHIDGDNENQVGVRTRFRRHRNEEGRFRVAPVEPGPVTLVAKAPAYAPTQVEVPHVGSGDTIRNIQIRLSGGVGLTGVVVDTDGRPVANAGIVPGRIPRDMAPDALAVVRTQEDGTFRLENLSPELAGVSACHPDYAVSYAPVALVTGRENRITIVLGRGGIVEGAVYYAGEPCPGQSVVLNALARLTAHKTKTDEHGAYRFENVDPGEVTVIVQARLEHPSSDTITRSLVQTAEVEERATTVLDFDFLPSNAALEGVVTVSGEPAPNAHISVVIETSAGMELVHAQVDGNGWYRIDNLPAGSVNLIAEMPDANRMRSTHLEILAGQVTRQDVELTGGASIEGVVSGMKAGEQCAVFALRGDIAFPGPDVYAVIVDHASDITGRARIDENGSYQLPGLSPGRYTVVATSGTFQGGAPEDMRFVATPIEITDETTTYLDIELE